MGTYYDTVPLDEEDWDDDMDTCDVEDCDNSLLDNEGYDGYCGTHADQFEAEGRWG